MIDFQIRCSSRSNPNYLIDNIGFILCPSILKLYLNARLVNGRLKITNSVLSTFKERLFEDSQLHRQVRSWLIFNVSFFLKESLRRKLVSSAKWWTLEFGIAKFMSLINIKNRKKNYNQSRKIKKNHSKNLRN